MRVYCHTEAAMTQHASRCSFCALQMKGAFKLKAAGSGQECLLVETVADAVLCALHYS